ncbi:tripartite tricarboxylate transporter substrate binding protein [Roseomonas indoligenes]|uniref:Tripartite tricarboxylate transporter substrate binding protein n=1 Tax=Roseomonas indoligenes TaxID=2820811 RepID=A0A940MV08_9PROT|nr:tripartite tricarboxylate transporter substrate binding protein [Pararoseomonas indoligenes]MBP0493954.1 tripartite tricarboxylate transporter substrate binding protein [Pararoseomonas indoligenes]
MDSERRGGRAAGTMPHVGLPAGRRDLLRLGAGAGLLVSLGAVPALGAETYPARPIRVIVPFTAGGGTDVVGRELAQLLSTELGQAVVIDNRAGGGTVLGSDLASKAPPDGYTLLLTTSALAINASLVKSLPYDTEKGFSEVGLICHGPNVVVVRPDSPYRSMADIIRAAKAKPGELTYGSSGNGSAVHLAAELLKLTAGVDITHVPYRGAGPAYTDLLGGRLDMVFGTAGGVASFVKGGQMRAVAVTSPQRTPAYEGVPTVAETLPGYEAEVWYAVFAPGGTPAPILARVNEAMRKVTQAPSYRSRLEGEGLTVAVNSPEEMTRFMRAEEARWRRVVTDGRITSD